MELRYREAARADVRAFVGGYIEGFWELYSDSGIWSEQVLLESVLANGGKLFNDLYNAIDARLAKKLVLGRKESGVRHGWFECRFSIGSRLVLVFYSEDSKQRIRWVESIAIGRKPIIF